MNPDDTQFQPRVIKSFTKDDDGYSLTFEDGWGFYMPDKGIAPRVGDMVKLYGKGTGFRVRGLAVNNHEIFYRTESEDEELFRKEQEERKAKNHSDYDAKAEEYDRRVSALPEQFKQRITDFRAQKPDWRYDFEPYELFVCEQAIEFANQLKTTDELKRFHKLDFAARKQLVPSLSDDHSGNTFGAACMLANLWLTRPELIPKAHGALCALVGCKDYGCYAARQKLAEEELSK